MQGKIQDILEKKLEDDFEKVALQVKHHEHNLRFLKTEMNSLDESILDVQVELGRYHSSAAGGSNPNSLSEHETVANILRQEEAAAGIICEMKIHHELLASQLSLTKDVLGVVATLGTVSNDNISRLFSEYLGLKTMLGIVCKTYEGIKALEKYDKEGTIDKSSGLQGLGSSIGMLMHGRFPVFCLETLRPYVGEFVSGDSQKRLALLKPRLPNGESPRGFVGFAVNMINIDNMHLSWLTASGFGLRETLFYNLFSRLQVYKTRADMQLARPLISDGAISLDGGMMKSEGLFWLGDREDVEVRFPIISGLSTTLPTSLLELKEELKLMNWKREMLLEDMKRQDTLLTNVKSLFCVKRHEYEDSLKQTESYLFQALLTRVDTKPSAAVKSPAPLRPVLAVATPPLRRSPRIQQAQARTTST